MTLLPLTYSAAMLFGQNTTNRETAPAVGNIGQV